MNNRKDIKERIEVLQAILEDKAVEIKQKNGKWAKATEEDITRLLDGNFRYKTNTRPYSGLVDFVVNGYNMKAGEKFVYAKNDFQPGTTQACGGPHTIFKIEEKGVRLRPFTGRDFFVSYTNLFESYCWYDNTICGVSDNF